MLPARRCLCTGGSGEHPQALCQARRGQHRGALRGQPCSPVRPRPGDEGSESYSELNILCKLTTTAWG